MYCGWRAVRVYSIEVEIFFFSLSFFLKYRLSRPHSQYVEKRFSLTSLLRKRRILWSSTSGSIIRLNSFEWEIQWFSVYPGYFVGFSSGDRSWIHRLDCVMTGLHLSKAAYVHNYCRNISSCKLAVSVYSFKRYFNSTKLFSLISEVFTSLCLLKPLLYYLRL